MSEIRFSYNPFTKDYIESGVSHSIAIYNKGKQKQFDEYIRGIILDDTLYLRLYYPFEDITEQTITEVKQKSYALLGDFLPQILTKLELSFKEIHYNVENDLLEGIGLANI